VAFRAAYGHLPGAAGCCPAFLVTFSSFDSILVPHPDMKQKRAQELREAWGDRRCEHPQLAKLYDLGAHTGSFACTRCGKVFSFREKAELAASRNASRT
jgi:hypothetical protein